MQLSHCSQLKSTFPGRIMKRILLIQVIKALKLISFWSKKLLKNIINRANIVFKLGSGRGSVLKCLTANTEALGSCPRIMTCVTQMTVPVTWRVYRPAMARVVDQDVK